MINKYIVEHQLGYTSIGADFVVIDSSSEDEPVAYFLCESMAEEYARFLNKHGR